MMMSKFSSEVADVLDVRDDLVTARFGKQANIIPLALVAVVLAQVENANVFLCCKFGISKVVFCRDDFGFGNVKLPILWRVHDNYFFHNVCTCGVFMAKLRRACQKPLLLFDDITIAQYFKKCKAALKKG